MRNNCFKLISKALPFDGSGLQQLIWEREKDERKYRGVPTVRAPKTRLPLGRDIALPSPSGEKEKR